MRGRPVRSQLYLPVTVFGVVSSDWKYVLAAGLIGYTIPYLLDLKLWKIPLELITSVLGMAATIAVLNVIRVDVVSIPGPLGTRHHMICVNPFYGGFVHNSKEQGRVVLEWHSAGILGSDVRLERIADAQRRDLIVHRATMLICQPYDLFSFNCEHFVNYVYDQVATSPQLFGGIVLSIAIAAVAVAIAGANKSAKEQPNPWRVNSTNSSSLRLTERY